MDGDDLASRIEQATAEGVVEDRSAAYDELLAGLVDLSPAELHKWLGERLMKLWISDYYQLTEDEPDIVEFSDGAFRYLFDLTLERVVAAWGPSRDAELPRDKTRQKGFIPAFTRHHPGKDRGHFLSHAQGGLMDVNFFPQKREVNRGWSPAGKLYRRMEKYCSATPGTFGFSRPLYEPGNRTWDPDRLEYGLLLGDRLRAVVFPN